MSNDKDSAEKTEIQASTLDASLRRKLHSLCTQHKELALTPEESKRVKESKDAQEVVRGVIKDLIEKLSADHKSVRIIGDRWEMLRTVKQKRTISATKLVELGVDLDTILAATDKKDEVSLSIKSID